MLERVADDRPTKCHPLGFKESDLPGAHKTKNPDDNRVSMLFQRSMANERATRCTTQSHGQRHHMDKPKCSTSQEGARYDEYT